MKVSNGNQDVTGRVDGLVYVLTAAAVLAGILWVFHCAPLLYVCLIAEDHFGEYATAVSLLLAAVLLATTAFRRGPRLRRWFLACACLIALWIGGEELSWGQRLLGFSTPAAFRGVNIQEEFNVHNLSRLEDMKLHAAAGYAVPAWVGLSVAVALARPAVRDRLDRTGFPLLPIRLVAPVSLFPYLLPLQSRFPHRQRRGVGTDPGHSHAVLGSRSGAVA